MPSISFEKCMRLDVNLDQQVACRPSIFARFSFATQTKLHPVVDASGDLDVDLRCSCNKSCSAAIWAFFSHNLSLTSACWTGGLHAKKSLGLDHLPSPAAVI